MVVLTSGKAKQVQNSVHVAMISRKFIMMCAVYVQFRRGYLQIKI